MLIFQSGSTQVGYVPSPKFSIEQQISKIAQDNIGERLPTAIPKITSALTTAGFKETSFEPTKRSRTSGGKESDVNSSTWVNNDGTRYMLVITSEPSQSNPNNQTLVNVQIKPLQMAVANQQQQSTQTAKINQALETIGYPGLKPGQTSGPITVYNTGITSMPNKTSQQIENAFDILRANGYSITYEQGTFGNVSGTTYRVKAPT